MCQPIPNPWAKIPPIRVPANPLRTPICEPTANLRPRQLAKPRTLGSGRARPPQRLQWRPPARRSAPPCLGGPAPLPWGTSPPEFSVHSAAVCLIRGPSVRFSPAAPRRRTVRSTWGLTGVGYRRVPDGAVARRHELDWSRGKAGKKGASPTAAGHVFCLFCFVCFVLFSKRSPTLK